MILVTAMLLNGFNASGCEKFSYDAKLKRQFGNHEAKLKFYNGAIAEKPGDPVLYLERGIVYSLTDEFDAAHEDYNRAISLDPRFADAYYFRGRLKYNYVLRMDGVRRYDERGALEDSNRAIELEKLKSRYTLSEAYCLRGAVHENRFMDYDGALKDFNAAVDSNRKNGWAYYHRASLYFFHLRNRPDRPVRIKEDLAVAKKIFRETGDVRGIDLADELAIFMRQFQTVP